MKLKFPQWALLLGLGLLGLAAFQESPKRIWSQSLMDSLNDPRHAQQALAGLEVHPALEVTVFATEPMLKNPTNIEVDAQGRIWVLEAYNYRPAISANPTNPAGDRILILEDSNQDGKADKQTVFYQGPEINAPLGICVLDQMVIVAQSPNVWKFYDDNRDGKADRKELFFQGISGEQHDHGAHAFVFGPDGKLYFNFGNEGKQLLDAKGKPVLDQDGDPIGPKKYKQGMVFRCNLDGSQVECLGHNFRNNYELALDSFGGIWQSDNDDDGNKGVRINAVFEHGNYGYTDEMTGAGWSVRRTNWEDEIPKRHWHLNDPGVVPNLLQTGAGSPTGMVFYEGQGLPKEFQEQMIHCDAGPNVVRAYLTQNQGAGYQASILPLLEGKRDQWFRPSDVCVAPDGSLYVSDWYDPGVGGHQAGDQVKGRIYRIAPKGQKPMLPALQLQGPAAQIQALGSPNLARRYMAFQALLKEGQAGLNALTQAYQNSPSAYLKARLAWVILQFPNTYDPWIPKLMAESDPRLRMMGIRAAKRKAFSAWKPWAKTWMQDPDPQVRRELAIALRHIGDPVANGIWSILAKQHSGKDRWYLEALGIGADGQWDGRLDALMQSDMDKSSEGFRQLIWRSRSAKSLEYLMAYLKEKTPLQNKLAYFRALDFNPSPEKSSALLSLITGPFKGDLNAQLLALSHMQGQFFQNQPQHRSLLLQLVRQTKDQAYLEMVEKYQVKEELGNILNLMLKGPQAAKAASIAYQLPQGAESIKKRFYEGDVYTKKAILEAIRGIGRTESLALIQEVMFQDNMEAAIQKEAAKSLGNSGNGEEVVLQLLRDKKVPTKLIPSLVESVSRSWKKGVRKEANAYLGAAGLSQNKTKHPGLNDLLLVKGNAKAGLGVFVEQCSMCHQVYESGIDFGPKLTEIGSKLSKEGLYISVLHPNAGIGFGFEGFEIRKKNGEILQGIINSRNETDIQMKLPGGSQVQIKTSDIKSIQALPESMMPEGLADPLSTQALADLIEYLSTLKKKNP